MRIAWTQRRSCFKKQLGLELSLYKILQILSETVFEKPSFQKGLPTSQTSSRTAGPVYN